MLLSNVIIRTKAIRRYYHFMLAYHKGNISSLFIYLDDQISPTSSLKFIAGSLNTALVIGNGIMYA